MPSGTPGAKLLVTVLFSRTQPLIRYEMSDCVSLSTERCACGLPFRLSRPSRGEQKTRWSFQRRRAATSSSNPNVFHRLLEPLPVKEWQVIQEAEGLRILLGRPTGPVEEERLAASVTRDLRDAGAEPPPVHVEIVDAVTRTKLGKAPLIKALRVAPDKPPEKKP